MLHCAVVGVGHIADDMHMPVYRSLPQVQVVAVCESDPGRAGSFQKRHGIQRCYSSIDDLLAHPDGIDFVDVATPPHLHYDHARKALDAGLHVVVEKPLALTAEEGRELGRLADRRGRKLGVVQSYRFREPILRAQHALKTGQLGRLQQITVTSHGDTTFATRSGWGWGEMGSKLLLYELGIHYVDLEMSFAGPVRGIRGFHASRDPASGGTSQIQAIVEHENGVTALLDLHMLSATNFVHFELFGSRQDVLIKLFPESYRQHLGHVMPQVELIDSFRRLAGFVIPTIGERLTKPLIRRRMMPHFRVLSGFVESLGRPGLDPPVTAAAVIPTLELLDSLHARIEGIIV